MPKSAKKSASKAKSSPAAAVAKQTQSPKNVKGKRDAEEIIEKKIVDTKKQKTANGGVPVAVENKEADKPQKKEEEEEEKEPEKAADVTKNGDVDAKMDSEDESESDDGAGSDEEDVKPASEVEAVAKPEAEDGSEEGSEDGSEEGSEECSVDEEETSEEEDEDEPKTSTKKASTPATPQATGSKTLFMGNLSFSIEESDVKKFFEDAGEVIEIRFAMRDDRFAGYGHVEFATPEAAQKALELNGELLLDRAVKLDMAKERGAYTPGTGNDRSSQKGGQSQALSIFVRGFSTDGGFDAVRTNLEGHFGKCGEISRLSIPKDFESGDPKGVAFIDFPDSVAFKKALALSGSDVNGSTITVEEAKARDGGGSGRGRGGRGGGGRGRSGGRGGGGRGRDGGRGRGRGGRRGRF